MFAGATAVATRRLTLPEGLILMLVNGENGYFHQVPGRDLNCAGVGAMLGELSLLVRIDTNMESLFLVGIASDPRQHSTQYWIERLANRAESITDLTLDRLAIQLVRGDREGTACGAFSSRHTSEGSSSPMGSRICGTS